ncbi:MAG: MotA/TolQ/ExbB proton channel family protein [Campylobacteraceae bacterium]|nr:MotA/TolQ/ExbB proton channel family protein [Campylobacteraceae bacterium]
MNLLLSSKQVFIDYTFQKLQRHIVDYLKNLVDYGVVGVLFLMSILSLYFFIERLFFYSSIDARKFKNKQKYENILTKNLMPIGTIASNAPYIGLLGTVLAIMLTFLTMSGGAVDPGEIMKSLALALKATAAGLVVAIISMIFYNILTRIAETKLAHFDEEV